MDMIEFMNTAHAQCRQSPHWASDGATRVSNGGTTRASYGATRGKAVRARSHRASDGATGQAQHVCTPWPGVHTGLSRSRPGLCRSHPCCAGCTVVGLSASASAAAKRKEWDWGWAGGQVGELVDGWLDGWVRLIASGQKGVGLGVSGWVGE